MCQIIHKTRTIFCVLFIDVRTLIHQCHDTWLEYFSVSMNTSLWHLASCLSGPEQCQVLTRSIDLCFKAKKFLEQSYVFCILRFLRNVFLIEDPLSPTMQTWKNGLLGSISPASTNPTHCSQCICQVIPVCSEIMIPAVSNCILPPIHYVQS